MSDSKDKKVDSVVALVAYLTEILETWPLYREFKYQAKHHSKMAGYTGQQEVHFALLPETLTLFCDQEECRKERAWELRGGHADGTQVYFGGQRHFMKGSIRAEIAVRILFEYFFLWKETADGGIFAKVGQYPHLWRSGFRQLSSKQLEKEDLDFYEKAVRLRNHGLGIASLAYLRRVIENRDE